MISTGCKGRNTRRTPSGAGSFNYGFLGKPAVQPGRSLMRKSTLKATVLLGLSLVLVTDPATVSHAKTRFIVLGDAGEEPGNNQCNQYKVARALKNWRNQ